MVIWLYNSSWNWEKYLTKSQLLGHNVEIVLSNFPSHPSCNEDGSEAVSDGLQLTIIGFTFIFGLKPGQEIWQGVRERARVFDILNFF